MARDIMRGFLAVGLAAGLLSASTAAYAIPLPDSGPVEGGTQVTTPAGVTFTTISTGLAHSVALDTNGNTWAWGYNAVGQLGTGNSTDANSPTPVATPAGATFTTVNAGWTHSLAIDTDGNTWAWGDNDAGQLGTGSETDANSPTPVATPPGVTFTTLHTGESHSLATDTNGNSWAWGDNRFGQLGTGNYDSTDTPTQVTTAPGVTFTTINTGAHHSLAIDTNGNTWAWGHNDSGQLGTGNFDSANTPTQVATPAGVTFTTIQASALSSLAIDTNGNTWAWGQNASGQLGTGNNDDTNTPTQVATPAGVTFTTIHAGDDHSLAIDTNGNTWAWGQNASGQLGTGNNDSTNTPTPVSTPPGVTFTSFSAGKDHSLAIDTNGNTWAWGWNYFGQLGTGNNVDTNTPTQVPLTVLVTGISFDDLLGTNLTDNGDGTWTVATPAHPAGPVDVAVNWTLNGVEQEPVVYENGFTYLDPTVAPTITDPADVTVTEGDTATFTTAATGDPTPEITWEYSTDGGTTWAAVTATDGTVSADGTTLKVTSTKAHNGYQYRATATNTAGTDTSAPATLTVKAKDETGGGGTGGGNTGGGATGGGNTGGGSLPSTGSDTTPLIAGALLLAGAGAALLVNARRKKTATN